MRFKVLALGSTLSATLTAMALVGHFGSGQPILTQFATKLNLAKSLSAKFTTMKIGGEPSNYNLVLAKPNLVRLDGPDSLVIADGKNVTTYDKSAKTYYVVPETDVLLKSFLNTDSLAIWQPFFDAKAMNPAPESRDLGTTKRKSITLQKIVIDQTSNKSATLYFSPDDNLVRQAEFVTKKEDGNESTVLNTQSVELSDNLPADTFAFNAPDGSRQLSLDEMSSDKWYTDLSAAEAVAKRTHKKIFVDFMASWCGPCKMLDKEVFHTDEFKKLSKYFVFLRVDVDEQPMVAQTYKITAMPTQLVLDDAGGVLGQTVGYGGPDAFFAFIRPFAS